ncbi:MAG: hypothetical protein HC876_23410 [Chloroflexaceae bacterium]|nr:hypothetical protein [Chloroflexaceae bacterium]
MIALSPTDRREKAKPGKRLAQHELYELADILAIQIHAWLGKRALRLHRIDIAELVAPYIDDLTTDDQKAIHWMIWHLFQDARDIAMES